MAARQRRPRGRRTAQESRPQTDMLGMADDGRQRAVGRDGATTAGIELAARARERSSAATAARRELRMESLVGAGFVVAAAAAWAALDGAAASPALAAWLTLICALLVRVEFEVGEGCTRPVQLVLAPMLVLLPAGAVPLAVGVAHVAAQLPAVLAPHGAAAAAALRHRRLVVLARAGGDRGRGGPAARLDRVRGADRARRPWRSSASTSSCPRCAPASAPASGCARCWCPSPGSGWSTSSSSPSACSPPWSARWRRRRSAACSRSRPCLPSSHASGPAGSTTPWRSSASRRRRATACSRSSRTRPTSSPSSAPTARWPRSPGPSRPCSGPTGTRRRASRCSTTCTPTTSCASTPSCTA